MQRICVESLGRIHDSELSLKKNKDKHVSFRITHALKTSRAPHPVVFPRRLSLCIFPLLLGPDSYLSAKNLGREPGRAKAFVKNDATGTPSITIAVVVQLRRDAIIHGGH